MNQSDQGKSPRRTQEERSDRMKRRILDAAFVVLKERGYAGFTTAEVAKRAGVSRGAQVHHFPSKNDLVLATMEYVFDMSRSYGVALAKNLPFSDDPLDAVIKDAATFYFSDYFYVGLDWLLTGCKDAEFKKQALVIMRNYRQPVEDEWRKTMLDHGMSPEHAADILWLTINIVRGAAIRAIWSPDMKQVERLLFVWRDMVSNYLEGSLKRRNRVS